MASDILWRRMAYMLTPQLDIYRHLAPRLEDKFVLEVGFGTGFGVLQYAHCAKLVHAIEPTQDAVMFAEKTIPLNNVLWLCQDIVTLSGKYKYDAVVMIEVLEHINQWEDALKSIRDRLADGGVLYMTAANANTSLRKNDLHEREWTGEELVHNLSKYFSEVKLYDYGLSKEQDKSSMITPFVAEARK